MQRSRYSRGVRLGADQDGQAMVEYIGVLVVVAVIIAGVLSLGLGSQITRGLGHAAGCVFGSCPSSGGTGGSGGPGAAAPTTATTTTPGTRDVSDETATCGQGGTPLIGPIPAGESRPCVSIRTGAVCTSQGTPPLLSTCTVGGANASTPTTATPTTATPTTPTPQPALPTADSAWAAGNDGGSSCPVGYDFHTYDGQPWCANSALDLDPGTLNESPWETNRSDYEPGSFNLACASTSPACSLPYPTPWAAAQKYYACYNEGGGDCDPPEYAPVVAPKDPSDDQDDPAHGYQVFSYGKPQEDAYDEIMEHAEKLIEGIHDSVEARQLLEERLEEAALARVSSEAWVREYVPNGDDDPDGDPIDGDGDDSDG